MFPSKTISLLARTFILRPSGTYQNQFHRNFTVDARLGQVGALVDTINSEGLTTITPKLLGTVGYDLLTLDSRIANKNPIAVPNDWGNRRGIFILALEAINSTGGRTNYYIQGYTDEPAFSSSSIDPRMRLYINNVVTATPTVEETNMGRLNSMRVSSNFQTPVDFSATSVSPTNPMVMARPQDIFGQMKNADFNVSDVFVSDRSNIVTNNLVSSRKRNNVPTSFLTSVFNGFAAGKRENNSPDFTAGDVAENAFDTVLEKDGLLDTFLVKVREANGLTRSQSHFTFAELCNAVPNVHDVWVPFQNANQGMHLSQASDSNHFAGQSISTIAAVQLASAMPALMLECMLSTLNIRVTNMVSGQLDLVLYGNPGCFAPDVAVRQFELFKDRFMREVIYPLTERGMINIDAKITCSFHSEFVIDIKMGDDPMTHFVAPTFCDSLFSPTVTNNPQVVKDLTGHIAVMCDHVAEAIGSSELRKDRIISKSLMAPMTGALSSRNDLAFGIPASTNGGAMAPLRSSNPMAVTPSNNPMAVRPNGPSMNRM